MTEKRKPAARRQILCAQCGALTTYEGNPWRPFCSERCKLIDLGQWAEERYRVPSEDSPASDEGEEK